MFLLILSTILILMIYTDLDWKLMPCIELKGIPQSIK